MVAIIQAKKNKICAIMITPAASIVQGIARIASHAIFKLHEASLICGRISTKNSPVKQLTSNKMMPSIIIPHKIIKIPVLVVTTRNNPKVM